MRIAHLVLTVVILVGTVFAYRSIGSVVLRAVRTGQWSMNGAVFDRADRSFMYYSAVLFFTLFVAMLTFASYAVILMWFDR